MAGSDRDSDRGLRGRLISGFCPEHQLDIQRAEQPLDVGGLVVGRDRDPQQAAPLPLADDDLDPVLVEEPPLQPVGVVRRDLGRPQLRRGRRRDGRQAVVEGGGERPALAGATGASESGRSFERGELDDEIPF